MSVYYEKEFLVDSRSVDMFHHCRPSALLGYLQEAATQAALELHASSPEIYEKYHCLWMITRIWAQLDAPLHWNERFTVRTWHRGTLPASTYRDYDLFRDGKRLGQATSVWVLVDADSRKLFPMRNLEEFQGTDGGELRKDIRLRGLKLPERFDSREQRPMRYSETDINGHINNVHYADFACDALHMERRDPGKFASSFQVDYTDECLAGEVLTIDCAIRDDRWFARGTGEDGSARFDFALELKREP